MSDLTDKIINCGQCSCDHKATAISYLEAVAARDVTKQACIDAVMKLPARGDMRRMAIQAINDVM